MLAKIAILIDDFQCEEALEHYTKLWIETLRTTTPVPITYCRDLVLWMLIGWVFCIPEEFTKCTAVAIRQCKGSVDTLELPIPAAVTGTFLLLLSFSFEE